MNKGILAGLAAFFLWGILPVYWKQLSSVPSLEILCHRIGWSFVFLVIILSFRKRPPWWRILAANPGQIGVYVISSILIGINWFVYIWSVNAGFIVESSLGYFINPLVSVLLGVFFLKEKLRWGQWVAVGIAFLGVLFLTLRYGSFPWIALALAFSFGLYGLTRKLGKLHSINGLSVETSFLFIPILSYLIYLEVNQVGSFTTSTLPTQLLLIGSGVVTAVPLLLFATAVKLVNLSTVGIMQYLAPTLQLLVGVFIYMEPFDSTRLQGFSIIWFALLIYSIETLLYQRRKLTPDLV